VITVREQPPSTGTRVGRRALLTLGALAVCGGAAAATPYVTQRVEDAARAAVLAELEQIEGIPIDAAIRAAEITRAAVQTIVLPVAQFVSLIGSNALGALLSAIDAARAAMKTFHLSTTMLDQFRVVVVSWQMSVTGLPIALDSYLIADIKSAETYLKSLKRMIDSQQANAIHLPLS
jgi:hypothetical protein